MDKDQACKYRCHICKTIWPSLSNFLFALTTVSLTVKYIFFTPSLNLMMIAWSMQPGRTQLQVIFNSFFSYASSSTLYSCQSLSRWAEFRTSVAWSLRACFVLNDTTFVQASCNMASNLRRNFHCCLVGRYCACPDVL